MNRKKKLVEKMIFKSLLFFSVAGALLLNGDSSNRLKITILYDNYMCEKNTKTDWGYACLIEGIERPILFDTGAKGDILEYNINSLNIKLDNVKDLFFSHNHSDHTGGMDYILKMITGAKVYMVKSTTAATEDKIKDMKCSLIRIDKETEICKNVHSTGEMGTQLKEQALIINDSKGLIILTGCSHQGVVEIVQKARSIFNKNIYFLGGGFHLMNHSKEEVEKIISTLKELGVEKCGASHCTGDNAIKLFKEAFGNNFVELGTGKVLDFN